MPHVDANATYDRQTVEVMRKVLLRDSNCVDIGGTRGTFSATWSRSLPLEPTTPSSRSLIWQRTCTSGF